MFFDILIPLHAFLEILTGLHSILTFLWVPDDDISEFELLIALLAVNFGIKIRILKESDRSGRVVVLDRAVLAFFANGALLVIHL